jgi:hypothetical protein
MTKTNRVLWTARCKSGYEFNGHVCQQVTRRGALLCDSCLSAEIIPSAHRASLLVRAMSAVIALFTA